MLKRIIFTLLISGLLFSQAHWQENGLPLRQGVHIEWQRTTASSDPGSAYIVWSDVRYGIRDVYAQRIDSTGSLLWGAEGLPVTSSAGRQE